jgi:hypothetical protein
MHNPTKYGVKIWIFPFESPKPWLILFEIEATLFEAAHLCKGFSWKYPIYHVFLFTSQLSHLFFYFWISYGHLNVGQTFETPVDRMKSRQKPACPNTNTQL